MKRDQDTSPGRHLFQLFIWLGRNEWFLLVLLALIFGGVWSFAELADEVLEGETRTFDETILLSLRHGQDLSDPLGPAWFEELMRDFTALGGIGILTTFTLGACGYLLLQGRRRTTLLVLISVGGGILISFLMKYGFSRPRPDLVPHVTYVATSSFPSGHSMMSAVTYLTLGGLLCRTTSRRRIKTYILVVAVLLTVLVGSSRVYLGVHWPTDVLAGWTVGATWALICWFITLWLQRRGQVESQGESDEMNIQT